MTKKGKSAEQKSTPTSLLHYTSMDVLTILLKDAIENEDHFSFHASIAHAMNDRIEGKLVIDKFFTDSMASIENKKILKTVTEERGEIFTIAFSRSKERYPNGQIPMWKMYGDNGRGVVLRFNYKLLSFFCKSKNYSLNKCQYITQSDEFVARCLRNEVKKEREMSLQPDEMNKVLREAYIYKERHWKYEDEYRMIIQSTDYKIKKGTYGITPYIVVPIPIQCLTGITIGPLAEQDVAEKSLNILVPKLKGICPDLDLSIHTSKLQLR